MNNESKSRRRRNLTLSQKIDLAIAKIMFLANQINRKTNMCCFLHDVAHCRYIEIKIHENKDDYNSVPVEIHMDYESDSKYYKKDSEEGLAYAEKCIEYLKNTLKNKHINYELLEAVEEFTIKSYNIL